MKTTKEYLLQLIDGETPAFVKVLEALRKRISHNIASVLGITATIRLVEPRSIERSEGKAKRLIDNRK